MSTTIPDELQALYNRQGFHFIRSFEDGRCEIRLLAYKGDRRIRCRFVVCERCKIPQPDQCYPIPSTLDEMAGVAPVPDGKVCSTCRHRAIEQERAEMQAAQDRWMNSAERKLEMMERGLATRNRRGAHFNCAKVSWRDQKKISEIYRKAKRLAKERGKPHDVDHIYPLQSLFGCGLHVHQNLRVLKASTNRSKSNNFPLKHSPAIQAALADGTMEPWLQEMRMALWYGKIPIPDAA